MLENFEYTKWACYESMRMDAPAPSTFPALFKKTVKVGGVEITPKDSFMVNFDAIQKDPAQWIDPERFDPSRFDPQSPMALKPNGEPRHPLAFCAFSGGKRVCLGKTFAEIMLKVMVPLILYHFEFEVADEIQKGKNKPTYQTTAPKAPVMNLKVKQFRPANI